MQNIFIPVSNYIKVFTSHWAAKRAWGVCTSKKKKKKKDWMERGGGIGRGGGVRPTIEVMKR